MSEQAAGAFAGPLAARAGPLTPRRETPQDAPFLHALFAAHAAAVLRPAGLSEMQMAPLIDMQHRSRTAAYAAAFPDARRWIFELDGAPVARLIEADEPGAVYVVDIAVAVAALNRGIGTAIVSALLADARARRLGVRAEVAMDNVASLALFGRLGFSPRDATDGVRLNLVAV